MMIEAVVINETLSRTRQEKRPREVDRVDEDEHKQQKERKIKWMDIQNCSLLEALIWPALGSWVLVTRVLGSV